MAFGKILKHLRTATDTSQTKLARELGITPGYLSLVESDKRQPSLPVLESAAAYFRIPAGFLLLQGVKLNQLKPGQRKLVREIRRNLVDYILELGFEERAPRHRSARGKR